MWFSAMLMYFVILNTDAHDIPDFNFTISSKHNASGHWYAQVSCNKIVNNISKIIFAFKFVSVPWSHDGTTILLTCLIRLICLHFPSYNHFGFQAAARYWHFVEVVWLLSYIFQFTDEVDNIYIFIYAIWSYRFIQRDSMFSKV